MAKIVRLALVLLAVPIIYSNTGEPPKDSARPIEIGFLEEVTDGYTTGGEEPREANFKDQVRLAFRYVDGEWQAFPHDVPNSYKLAIAHQSFQGDRDWIVSLEGQRIGQVRSTGAKFYGWYKDVGIQNVIGRPHVAAPLTRASEYAGWMGDPVHRPLVVTRVSQIRILDDWNQTTWKEDPPADAVEWLFQHLKLHRADTDTPTELSQQEIRGTGRISVNQAFRSSDSDYLLALWYETDLAAYYDAEFGSLERPCEHWFLQRSNKSEYLASGMIYLDRGDYDGDGHTEFVFFIDKYNENGYALFFDDFRKSAKFVWSYH